MRLKINALFVILSAALLPACLKTEAELPDNSISFKAVASKATKAIIEGSTYPTSESFVVSAYYDGTSAYFEDLTASYNSTSTFWETSEAQYWPLSGTLDFIAYSPASASLTIDAANGVTATDYTIQTTTQMTTDLCYASAEVADCDNHPASVPLNFSHALSQIEFRVKAAAYYSGATISLTSLGLTGIYSVGDFSSGSWSNVDTEFAYTLSSSSTPLTYTDETPNTLTVCSYLFLPQTLSKDAAITVGYGITQTVSGTDYTLENSPVSISLSSTVSAWDPGKKYIYTLSIGMNNVITFTASAESWGSEAEEIIVEEN